jgi:hypothetical protein
MGSAKLLAVVLSVAVFSGCSSIMGQTRMEYQDNHSVVAGQVVDEEKGLYHVSFPHEHYYLERSPYRLAFVPKDNWESIQGPYAIKVFPKTQLAKGYSNDLLKIFDLLARKEIGRRAFRQAVFFKQEVRDFRGESAQYKEFFIPEKITKNIDGDQVKTPAFGYVGIVFMHGDKVYWLVHGEPIDEMVLEGKKIAPRVEQKTVDRMQSFLDSFAFGSSK